MLIDIASSHTVQNKKLNMSKQTGFYKSACERFKIGSKALKPTMKLAAPFVQAATFIYYGIAIKQMLGWWLLLRNRIVGDLVQFFRFSSSRSDYDSVIILLYRHVVFQQI